MKGARTAIRLRKPQGDKLDPAPTGAVDQLLLAGLIIMPRESYEEGRGWVTIEGWEIWILQSSTALPAGGARRRYADGDILSTDQIRIDGKTWQVDGEPAPFDKGTVRKATRIRVKRVG